MRSLILTIALMVASLGAVAVTPDKADARPPRGYWYGSYYNGPYYNNGYWYGATDWRGGTVWRPRYYGYYGPRYNWGSSYYYPREYYYGTYYGPTNYYYWP
jgi:hypothetical protein